MTMQNLTQSSHEKMHLQQQDNASQPHGAVDYALIEAMFFAYRDFIKEPDEQLEALGLGRAHHRVLYFVHRTPDLSVAQLLSLLQITKQSLNRVLSMLLSQDYITQTTGSKDRRTRHLRTTQRGAALVEMLADMQNQRLNNALKHSKQNFQVDPRCMIMDFLKAVQNSDARGSV